MALLSGLTIWIEHHDAMLAAGILQALLRTVEDETTVPQVSAGLSPLGSCIVCCYQVYLDEPIWMATCLSHWSMVGHVQGASVLVLCRMCRQRYAICNVAGEGDRTGLHGAPAEVTAVTRRGHSRPAVPGHSASGAQGDYQWWASVSLIAGYAGIAGSRFTGCPHVSDASQGEDRWSEGPEDGGTARTAAARCAAELAGDGATHAALVESGLAEMLAIKAAELVRIWRFFGMRSPQEGVHACSGRLLGKRTIPAERDAHVCHEARRVLRRHASAPGSGAVHA